MLSYLKRLYLRFKSRLARNLLKDDYVLDAFLSESDSIGRITNRDEALRQILLCANTEQRIRDEGKFVSVQDPSYRGLIDYLSRSESPAALILSNEDLRSEILDSKQLYRSILDNAAITRKLLLSSTFRKAICDEQAVFRSLVEDKVFISKVAKDASISYYLASNPEIIADLLYSPKIRTYFYKNILSKEHKSTIYQTLLSIGDFWEWAFKQPDCYNILLDSAYVKQRLVRDKTFATYMLGERDLLNSLTRDKRLLSLISDCPQALVSIFSLVEARPIDSETLETLASCRGLLKKLLDTKKGHSLLASDKRLLKRALENEAAALVLSQSPKIGSLLLQSITLLPYEIAKSIFKELAANQILILQLASDPNHAQKFLSAIRSNEATHKALLSNETEQENLVASILDQPYENYSRSVEKLIGTPKFRRALVENKTLADLTAKETLSSSTADRISRILSATPSTALRDAILELSDRKSILRQPLLVDLLQRIQLAQTEIVEILRILFVDSKPSQRNSLFSFLLKERLFAQFIDQPKFQKATMNQLQGSKLRKALEREMALQIENRILDYNWQSNNRLATQVLSRIFTAEELFPAISSNKEFQKYASRWCQSRNSELDSEDRTETAFIVSFPRSGSNFMQSVLDQSSPFINRSLYAPNAINSDLLLTLKSHAPTIDYLEDEVSRLYPSLSKRKLRTIVLVRDPRDLFISFYEFTQNERGVEIPQEDFLEKCDYFYSSFIDKTTGRHDLYNSLTNLGAFKLFVSEWAQLEQGEDSIIVKYEDLVANPRKTFSRLYKFLNISHSYRSAYSKKKTSLYSDEKKRPRGSPGGWKQVKSDYSILIEKVETHLRDEMNALEYL